MGMPRDLAAYFAEQARLRAARGNPAQQAATAPRPGTAGRTPTPNPAEAAATAPLPGTAGRTPAASPAPADEPAAEPAPAPAPATNVISTPAPVAAEEPAPATTGIVDFQRLLDEQAAQFETQMAASRAQAEETRRQQRQSANEIITARLADYGLESLGAFVSNLVFTEGVVDTNIIMGRLRATPEYKQRFAGNEARRRAGLNVLSEAEYVALENSFRQLMRQSGLPPGFYDSNDDFTTLIANDVSVGELSERVNQGYEAVMNADPEVVSEMRRLYNIGDGELAAYFLDPERATPTLLRQARSAQIAGAFVQQADMELSQAQALQLEAAGISPEQARAGAQAITGAQELFRALPGEAEEDITQEEQIAGVFGTSAAAQQRIRQRTRERQAVFEAGGGFAAQGSQVTGLT